MTEFPSPYSAEGSGDNQWRRPTDAADAVPLKSDDRLASELVYEGPPPATPVDPRWRPPTMVTVPAPRNLPPQDPDSIDHVERRALVTTYGIGMIAGAIGLVLLIVLCGRAVF